MSSIRFLNGVIMNSFKSFILAIAIIFSNNIFTAKANSPLNMQDFKVACFDAHDCVLDTHWPTRITNALSNWHRLPIFLAKTICWAIMHRKKYAIEWMHLNKDRTCNQGDIEIMNADKPNKAMMNYVKSLQLGQETKTCLCSNLGLNAVLYYSDKYPEYFGKDGVFDYYAISGFSGPREDLKKALEQLRELKERDLNKLFVNKKNKAAFDRCKNMLIAQKAIVKPIDPKTLMIDDSEKKLKVAKLVGFTPYRFTTAAKFLKDFA